MWNEHVVYRLPTEKDLQTRRRRKNAQRLHDWAGLKGVRTTGSRTVRSPEPPSMKMERRARRMGKHMQCAYRNDDEQRVRPVQRSGPASVVSGTKPAMELATAAQTHDPRETGLKSSNDCQSQPTRNCRQECACYGNRRHASPRRAPPMSRASSFSHCSSGRPRCQSLTLRDASHARARR